MTWLLAPVLLFAQAIDLPSTAPELPTASPSAHDGPVDKPSHTETDEQRAPGAPGAEKSEHGHEHGGKEGEEGEEEEEWGATFDFVVGSGTLDVLSAGPPTTSTTPPTNVFDSTRIRANSIMLGLERHLGEHFDVGARIPFVFGSLVSRDKYVASRDEVLFGNLELEGAYLPIKTKDYDLTTALELALPLGGGTEQPLGKEVDADKEKQFKYSAIDRGALGKVAEWTRGSYESALFEPGRLGVIPRISAKLRTGPFTFRPTVKVESLFDTTGDAAEKYIGEFVAGLRMTVRVHEFIEPGFNVWTNITFTKHEERDLDIAVISPLIRFPVSKTITPEVAMILPFFGRLVDEKVFGFRAGFAAEF